MPRVKNDAYFGKKEKLKKEDGFIPVNSELHHCAIGVTSFDTNVQSRLPRRLCTL